MKGLTKITVCMMSNILLTLPAYALEQDSTVQNKSTTIIHQAKHVMNDTAITTAIKVKFLKSELLNPFKIAVKTENSNVFLSGIVNTNIQYEEAIILAEVTEGVKQVNADGLQVKRSDEPLTDSYITAKIKGILLKEKIMGSEMPRWTLQIETKDRIVYLKGSVASEHQKDTLINIAKSIRGVRAVRASLAISS